MEKLVSKWIEMVCGLVPGKKHGSQEIGMITAKRIKGSYYNDKPVNLWSWWYFDGTPMQEGKYNEEGEFEGLYFINPTVPEFFIHDKLNRI